MCGLFAKSFRIPSRGIIESRMYKYHQPWTISDRWFVRRICTQKRKPCWSRIHARGGHSHKTWAVCGRNPTATTFVFGPFVASWTPSSLSRIIKELNKKEVKRSKFRTPGCYAYSCSRLVSVSCVAPCRLKKKKDSCWVYIRVPDPAVRDEGEEMKWNPRKSNVQLNRSPRPLWLSTHPSQLGL